MNAQTKKPEPNPAKKVDAEALDDALTKAGGDRLKRRGRRRLLMLTLPLL